MLPRINKNWLKAQQQFDKLGAVNLAASEEYEEVTAGFQIKPSN